jgi:hypothetical protein
MGEPTPKPIRFRLEIAPASEGPDGSNWRCVLATADKAEADAYILAWFRRGDNTRLRILDVH